MNKVSRTEARTLSASSLALILLFVLACNCNLGDDDKKSATSNNNQKSGVESNAKRPSGIRPSYGDDNKTSHGTSEAEDKGDFLARYSDIGNPAYVDFDKKMRDQKVLEAIAQDLNNALALPGDVTITFKDCGQPNAFYQPNDKSITMCYEFMDLFYTTFLKAGKSEEEANKGMFGATTFFFLHELGHCMIDVYNLPSTGREEDAVDQLSTYVLLDEMGEEGEAAAGSGAFVFNALAGNEQGGSPAQFADEHSLSSQRFFNLACWIYGKDPQKYASLVQDGVLPEARAGRCPGEYEKLASAWKRLLQPYRKN